VIFRIDDVSVNTNQAKFEAIAETIRRYVPDGIILAAVSPMVHEMTTTDEPERVFPRVLNAMSDHRKFFHVQRAGIPTFWSEHRINVASHGLVHVDHRLLGREAQEMSIIMSCALLKTDIFVPPFNKYNQDTQSVCDDQGVRLVRFESGWEHVRFNAFNPGKPRIPDEFISGGYYLHTHDTDADWLDRWFRGQS
jgi:hypothetical protein